MMQCTVTWAGLSSNTENPQLNSGMRFDAMTGSGHIVSMDGAIEGGGNNTAARPLELLLAGTGGCSAYDVVLILKRSRQQVTGCTVQLSAERALTDPKVFTTIHFEFTVTGMGLNPATVERAVALSHEKYCSASIMLAHSVAITYSVKVLEISNK
jgi:putative redox protein